MQYTGGGSGLLTLHGAIDRVGKLSGSFTWTESFNSQGTDYSCAAGTVTFAGGTGRSLQLRLRRRRSATTTA